MQRSPIEIESLVRVTGRITVHDVWYFRDEVFRDGIVSKEEAEAIFALDAVIEEKCPEGNEFFVEALTDFIVDEAEPRGYVSLLNAEWLISRVSHNGRPGTMTELELLVRVLNRAKSSPDILVSYTLQQIMRTASQGTDQRAGDEQLAKGIGEEASRLFAQIGQNGITQEDGIALLRILSGEDRETGASSASTLPKSA